MFCTNCQVVFHWSNLEIVRDGDVIHNPHFHQVTQMASIQESIGPIEFPVNAYRDGKMKNYMYQAQDIHQVARSLVLYYDNSDLQKRLLQNIYSEVEYKKRLFRREMKQQFNRAMFFTLESFVKHIIELYHRSDSLTRVQIQGEYERLRRDSNRELCRLGRLFRRKPWFIRQPGSLGPRGMPWA